jgi:hypothetical protein
LKKERAQWMHTWSSGKSNPVSDIYSSHDVRNAQPCTLLLLKLLGAPSLIHEVCAIFGVVVAGDGGDTNAGGGGCNVFCLEGAHHRE